MSELRYDIYLRKSSEAEDRQAPSLDSQYSNLEDIIKDESLQIVNVYKESCSAKTHGKRQDFYAMAKDLEQGKANAILVWSPNRISRNAVDTGLIIDLLDREKLLEVKTPSQIFTSNPNDKFFFNLLCSQAKLENDNKGIDVKRGLKRKAEMGWHPGRIKLGYLNDVREQQGFKTITKDPARFELVKKMFHMACEGTYTPAQVYHFATNEWGLTRPNGKPFSISAWYAMLHNSFYYGEYEYPVGSGNIYQGKHTPMITRAQYDKIQTILGRVDKAKPKTHEFLFTGLMKCGECNRSISADRKKKVQKNGNRHEYIYYRCARRFHHQCSQKVVQEHVIHNYFIEQFRTLQLSPEIFDWIKKTVRTSIEKGVDERNRINRTYQTNFDTCEKKLAGLIDMRANSELSSEEFLQRKQALSEEKEQLHQKIIDSQTDVEQVLRGLKKTHDFAQYAIMKIQQATDIYQVKGILKVICTNLSIMDKKPAIELKTPFQLFNLFGKGMQVKNGFARTAETLLKQGKLAYYLTSFIMCTGNAMTFEPFVRT